jgi:hypothetical protein
MIGDGISDAYNSEEARAILGAGFGAIDEAYNMGAEEAKHALRVAAGLASAGCLSLEAALRTDVLRDFFQIIQVFSTLPSLNLRN